MKPPFKITSFKYHMVVDTSICMGFPPAVPMKGLRFPTGSRKGFLHNFFKRFTFWKSISIRLAVWNVVRTSSLLGSISSTTLLGELSVIVFLLYIIYFHYKTQSKSRGRAIFKNFVFQTIMGKIFADNSFHFPNKLMLQEFTFRFHFTTLLMGKGTKNAFNFGIVY